jgi:hypothetical protein
MSTTTTTTNQLLPNTNITKSINMLYTYKPSTTSTMNKNQNKQKKRKQRGNKAKEVASWDIIENETQQAKKAQKAQGHWVPGTIPQSVINKMPWGDLDELTNEEYGYWSLSES